MRYLVSTLIVLPFLTSCIQEEYPAPGYYNRPAPQAELRHYHANNNSVQGHDQGYRPAPNARTTHGHGQAEGNAVVVTPRPRAQIEHTHSHDDNRRIHGHKSESHSPSDREAAEQISHVHR